MANQERPRQENPRRIFFSKERSRLTRAMIEREEQLIASLKTHLGLAEATDGDINPRQLNAIKTLTDEVLGQGSSEHIRDDATAYKKAHPLDPRTQSDITPHATRITKMLRYLKDNSPGEPKS